VPDNVVIALGPGEQFVFNFDYCKGFGIRVSECPCGAIKMVPDTFPRQTENRRALAARWLEKRPIAARR